MGNTVRVVGVRSLAATALRQGSLARLVIANPNVGLLLHKESLTIRTGLRNLTALRATTPFLLKSGLMEPQSWDIIVNMRSCNTLRRAIASSMIVDVHETSEKITSCKLKRPKKVTSCKPKRPKNPRAFPARAHPPVPPGELSPHGSPQLFPQGSSSRANTSPRSPRGTFSARVAPTGALPARTSPRGVLPARAHPPRSSRARFVPVIGTIVPRGPLKTD